MTPETAVNGGNNRYGYVIVGFSFIIQAVGYGLLSSFGVFFNPILAEFGWSRAGLSLATTINSFCGGAGSIASGGLNDRFGPRIVMTVNGVLFGLGYALMSRVNTQWQLYLAYGIVVGVGASAINIVLLSTVARWFTSRRSMMSAITKTGAGIGIFIMPLFITILIKSSGWRNTFLVLGLAVSGIIVIAAQFLRRLPARPEAVLDIAGHSGGIVATVKESGLSFRETIRTRQFWLLCLAYATFFYSLQAVLLHLVPYAVDSGVTNEKAAILLSIIGIVSTAGRLALGYIGDKWGTKRGLVLCAFILIGALVWLQFARGITMLYLFAAIYGLFQGGFLTIMTPVVASLFGTRSIGSILGTTQFFGTMIGGLGAWLTGFIFDRLHSYAVAFLICLGLSILGMFTLFFIRQVGKGQAARF